MVVIRPFIEMVVPESPKIIHRKMGNSRDAGGDRGALVRLRVLSWANSVVVIGVRIHALLAGEAKANLLAVFGMSRDWRTKAQQRGSQEISDFLMPCRGRSG